MKIPFGTDGWRAVIADGFTFESVRQVARAMAIAAREIEAPERIDRGRIAVGYDRRFLSLEFAQEVARELRDSGYRVLLSDAPTPSQTISHAVATRGIIGGIVVTASHNPAAYNGLKFKGWYGGSALPSIYAEIARHVGSEDRRDGGSIEEAGFLGAYVDALRGLLDLPRIDAAGLRILHDPIHGAASGVPERILGPGARARMTTIRGEINPSFGGVHPEPIPENLGAAFAAMSTGAFDLAICNDGDADRLGVLDETGAYVSPHKIISLLALSFSRQGHLGGELVKTISTTRLIERIAQKLGLRLHETPVGFKYVTDLMLTRNILIGGEESGGIGFGRFLPERDGILSGLMVAEAMAVSGKPLSRMITEMEEEFGTFQYGRRDVRAPMERCERLLQRAVSGELDGSFGRELEKRETLDGVKLSFRDGSWILFRKSGTEPLIRIYCESGTMDEVEEMLDKALEELQFG